MKSFIHRNVSDTFSSPTVIVLICYVSNVSVINNLLSGIGTVVANTLQTHSETCFQKRLHAVLIQIKLTVASVSGSYATISTFLLLCNSLSSRTTDSTLAEVDSCSRAMQHLFCQEMLKALMIEVIIIYHRDGFALLLKSQNGPSNPITHII